MSHKWRQQEMTNDDHGRHDFTEWLTRNPPPALHDLVQCCGGYHRVPADAWAQFDLDIADWQARRIRRLKWA